MQKWRTFGRIQQHLGPSAVPILDTDDEFTHHLFETVVFELAITPPGSNVCELKRISRVPIPQTNRNPPISFNDDADYRAGFRRGRSETLPLGGHSWRGQSAAMLYAANPYIRRRAADYLTWRMLERREHPEHSRDASRIRELAHYWQRPALYYGLGPAALIFGRTIRSS